VKTFAGLALVALHVLLFVRYVPSCRRPELVIELRDTIQPAGPRPAAIVPPALRKKVSLEPVGHAPGLVHENYVVRYRGGFQRSVGVTALSGPFQDPAKPECSGRVVVGQRLLDDGKAGPGTVAGEMVKNLEAEMKGQGYFGIGDFERVSHTQLRWARLENHQDDKKMIGEAPHGYVRVSTRLVFERITVPIVVALVPKVSSAELKFRVAARAQLDFNNRVLQWTSDKLGGDAFATRLARREIDAALITTLAPPPPFELPDGQVLRFIYCDGPPEIIDGVSGALPFAVAIGRVDGDPRILPPRRGRAQHPPLGPNGIAAIDLDLDGLNALLYELWRTGFLDRRLAEAGLDRRFNSDPLVQEFLSLRISKPVLALPPVLGAFGNKLHLHADARVAIDDRGARTTGRVWGGIVFQFAPKTVEPVGVDLGALELSCERTPTTLVPCYADLVGALRDRGADFHGELTTTFTRLLAEIFVDRTVAASGFTAELAIRGATPSVMVVDRNAALHLELDATLVAPK
jgi:hypothetical protein